MLLCHVTVTPTAAWGSQAVSNAHRVPGVPRMGRGSLTVQVHVLSSGPQEQHEGPRMCSALTWCPWHPHNIMGVPSCTLSLRPQRWHGGLQMCPVLVSGWLGCGGPQLCLFPHSMVWPAPPPPTAPHIPGVVHAVLGHRAWRWGWGCPWLPPDSSLPSAGGGFTPAPRGFEDFSREGFNLGNNDWALW